MSIKNIEGMKKLIEEKKKRGTRQSTADEKPDQKIGSQRKAFKNTKRGGFFDK